MLAYCDYIADRIKRALDLDLRENRTYTKLGVVGHISMDLDAAGAFVSTKRTIVVEDKGGKRYRLTIEEE